MPASQQPSGNGAVYARVAEQLKGDILTARLKPGDRLIESELVSMYGISRGTVREALKLLISEQLVRTVRGRTGGTYVAEVRPNSVSSMLLTTIQALLSNQQVSLSNLVEVRQVIEPFAASLAAARCEPADGARLRSALALPADQDRHSRHWEWHRAVLHLSRNPLLPALAEPVYELLSGRFDRSLPLESHVPRIEKEHEIITSLIENGDSESAESAMRKHLSGVHLIYLDLASESFTGAGGGDSCCPTE
jgi:GntR family transcriptional repressor for pyruvate dehydrogenase complex